jgi:hypothetical protein
MLTEKLLKVGLSALNSDLFNKIAGIEIGKLKLVAQTRF